MQLSVTYATLNILLILSPGTLLEMCKNVWLQRESMGNHKDYKFDMCGKAEELSEVTDSDTDTLACTDTGTDTDTNTFNLAHNCKAHNMASLYFSGQL